MMNHLLAAMRTQALLSANTRAVARSALVTSYDPNAYAVKVELQPEGTPTGWMPLVSPWVGNGWGLFAPPTIGDMIEVHFSEADPNVCYAAQRFYSDVDRPLPAPSGEFWLVHQSGSMLKFLNDGDVQLVTSRDLIVQVGRDINATVEGDANLTVGGDATATITGAAEITANGGVKIDGSGGGATKGIVQGDCVCAFTGKPHAMISANVKGSV